MSRILMVNGSGTRVVIKNPELVEHWLAQGFSIVEDKAPEPEPQEPVKKAPAKKATPRARKR